MKTKRPVSVIGWTVVLLLIPFLNFIICAYVQGYPFFDGSDESYFRLIKNIVQFVLCLLMAIGLFSIRKWGWWLYAGSLILLFGHNIVLLFVESKFSLIWLIILNLSLTLAGFLLFKKQIIAPYFNADLRFRQQAKRFGVATCLKGSGWSGNILNLSLSGCFIETTALLEMGKVYPVTLQFMSRSLGLSCRVMREVKVGDDLNRYGIMFIRLGRLEFRQIERILRLLNIYFPPQKREAGLEEQRIDKRVNIDIITVVEREGVSHKPALLDISLTGLLIKSQISIPLKESLLFSVALGEVIVEGKASAVWCDDSDIDGYIRYGLSFEKLDSGAKASLKIILKRFKNLGSRYKEVDIRAYDKISDENVLATPRRFFMASGHTGNSSSSP